MAFAKISGFRKGLISMVLVVGFLVAATMLSFTIFGNSSAKDGEVNLYIFSDTHIRSKGDDTNGRKEVNNSVKEYIKGDLDPNGTNLVCILGDLMDNNQHSEDSEYLKIWGHKACKDEKFTVCDLYGNHDIVSMLDVKHFTFSKRYKNIIKEQAAWRKEALANYGYKSMDVKQDLRPFRPDNHYKQALYRWYHVINGVKFHFIVLNLGYMIDDDDPKYSETKEFFKQALKEIGDEPMFILQHYGFNANDVSGHSSEWWPQKEQEEFIKLIENRNVMALLNGHVHSFLKGADSRVINGTQYKLPFSHTVALTGSSWSIMKLKLSPKEGYNNKATIKYEKVSKNSGNGSITVTPIKTAEWPA